MILAAALDHRLVRLRLMFAFVMSWSSALSSVLHRTPDKVPVLPRSQAQHRIQMQAHQDRQNKRYTPARVEQCFRPARFILI
jgi:hypothetical protein